MVSVKLDDKVYADIAEIVSKHPIDYPTVVNFVNKVCRDKIRDLKLTS